MITSGKTGSAPDWYPLIKAARYLGVPPWELDQMPVTWITWARDAENAEIIAANQRNQR